MKGTELNDVEVKEVSLVKRGANKRRIALKKGDTFMNTDILKAVFETEVDKEEELLSVFKELSDKGKAALKSALRLMMAYKDELPKDAVTKLAGMIGYEENEEDKKTNKVEEKEYEETKKQLVELQEENKKLQEELKVGKKDDGNEMNEGIKKALDDMNKENVEIKKQLVVEQEKRMEREWSDRVSKSASYVPGQSNDQIVAKMLRFAKIDPKLAEEEFVSLEQISKSMEESKMLKTHGFDGGANTSSVMQKVEKLVKEMISKSDSKLTKEQAMVEVMKKQPELYNEYLIEESGGE